MRRRVARSVAPLGATTSVDRIVIGSAAELCDLRHAVSQACAILVPLVVLRYLVVRLLYCTGIHM